MILDRLDKAGDLWPYAERYLGGQTRSYSSFSADLEVDEEYHPQRGRPSFAVPTFWVPDGAGQYLDNGIGSELTELYREDGRFLLPVHPQTLAALGDDVRAELGRCEPGPELTAVPSANVRTLFVTAMEHQPIPQHFVKLHYPRRLSRFTRRLRRPIISVQLWVAAELHRIGLPFLPEVGAGVFGPDPTQAWGFLLREHRLAATTPLEYTVPLFALYGRDVRAPGEPSLVEQLIIRSGVSATAFLTERVVRPMVRLWVRGATEVGCALEMHGQNTLFGFSADALSTVVGYRDCGVYVDPAVRAGRGLPVDGPGDLPPINVIGRDVRFPREQVFSLAYDSFLGHHALGFLARGAREAFGVREADLQAAAREEFSAGGLLAATVSYYDDQLHADGGWELVDTGVTPDWR